jgi:serine/threonine protein kinase
MDMASHYTLEEIERYASGQLEEPRLSLVRDHIEHCEACRHLFEECVDNAKLADELCQAVEDQSLGNIAPEDDTSSGMETIEGYRLIREIYRGGQGVVYEAFQKATRRKVALKVLLGVPMPEKPPNGASNVKSSSPPTCIIEISSPFTTPESPEVIIISSWTISKAIGWIITSPIRPFRFAKKWLCSEKSAKRSISPISEASFTET